MRKLSSLSSPDDIFAVGNEGVGGGNYVLPHGLCQSLCLLTRVPWRTGELSNIYAYIIVILTYRLTKHEFPAG